MPLTLMQNDFVAQLLSLFARYAVAPQEVIIEITKSRRCRTLK